MARSRGTANVAEAYLSEIICRHGSPEILITDRGRNFTSKLMRELCRLTQTQKIFTTSFHPMCNGLTEKLNHTLIQTLSFMVSESQKDWDQFLDIPLFAYRTARHATTKQSPFQMLYGREARLPVDIFFKQPETSDNDLELPNLWRRCKIHGNWLAKIFPRRNKLKSNNTTLTAQTRPQHSLSVTKSIVERQDPESD